MIMATCGVLAYERCAATIVKVKNLILEAVHINSDVSACYWRMTDHVRNSWSLWIGHANGCERGKDSLVRPAPA